MDKTDALNSIAGYISLVADRYSLERVFLFGSYAKGANTAYSDIDVALIISNAEDIFDLQVQLLRIRTDDNLAIEPHPFFPEDFNRDNPVAREILEYGIEINFVQNEGHSNFKS